MKFGETLVLLGIFVVLPTIIVWLVSRYKKHETDKRAEMALAAIEKDSDLDLEAFFWKMNLPSRTIKEKLLDKLLWNKYEEIAHNSFDGTWFSTIKPFDYLNSIHVDYRGLIEKGLAIEVTEENNPYN